MCILTFVYQLVFIPIKLFIHSFIHQLATQWNHGSETQLQLYSATVNEKLTVNWKFISKKRG